MIGTLRQSYYQPDIGSVWKVQTKQNTTRTAEIVSLCIINEKDSGVIYRFLGCEILWVISLNDFNTLVVDGWFSFGQMVKVLKFREAKNDNGTDKF
jgi:hypothetical protein